MSITIAAKKLRTTGVLFALCVGLFFGCAFGFEAPRYEIDASVDVIRHSIQARQKVTFTNNTDAPVRELYFHIYPRRNYTESEKRFMYRYASYFKVNAFPEGFQSGDLCVQSVFSAGAPLDWQVEGADRTILKVVLASELGAGQAATIDMDFQVTIPHSYGRFGWHKNIITLLRWYPVLSVLDKSGWHNYPFYIYHQPFFTDAGHYTVRLAVPQNQKVVATGLLQEEKISSSGIKTLTFRTEFPVRDFGVGISDAFGVWVLQDGGVTISAYYLAGDRARAEDAARNASALMKFYAQHFGPYPYRTFAIVPSYLAYGGDQSSNLVFIDTRVYKLPGFLNRYFDFLIAHETGHQWFYNLIGSDEYKEMFLDEGMNSYWLLRYLEDKYGPRAQVMELPKWARWFMPNLSFRDSVAARYMFIAKNGFDHAVVGELSSFKEPSTIFALAYGKGAAVIEMLRSYIGDEVFQRVMQRYTSQFRFQNISLDQFQSLCEQESGRNLDAFFGQWLKSTGSADFSVKKVTSSEIILENRRNAQMPVQTRIAYRDGTQVTDVWDGQAKQHTISVPEGKKVSRVVVDPDSKVLLDLDRTNNYWPRQLYTKKVPLYLPFYEIPLFMPSGSYNLVAGPTVGGSSLGAGASAQKSFDGILRLSTDYDFSDKAFEGKLGYELAHLFNSQTTAGFEIFGYAYNKDRQDLTGGKLYLRRELWPMRYGLFDLNDHVTLYLIRDQRMEGSAILDGQENSNQLYYRKNDEAIVGLTGSLGRYGTYPDPDYGWKFIPTVESAGHFLGGNQAFWRTSAELDNYRLILPRQQHKLAGKIKIGWGEASDKTLFQLGGPDGLRGFSRKTIEGAHMMLGSLEYRFPFKSDIKWYFLNNIICLDQIQGVGFFDAGKAWHADFGAAKFKKDVGFGLRLHFSLLAFLEKTVARIDLAQPINEPKENIHLWFGVDQTF